MIVFAIVPVTVVRRRSYDGAKLVSWQALHSLASITVNYLEGLAVQMLQ
jgi:hypothetical protein